MRVPIQRRRNRLEMNMTPMIDVVFLLIIFFLVSSHLAKQEVQAELDLPVAETGTKSQETETPRVTINIGAQDDDYAVRLGARPVTPQELRTRLARERETSGIDLEIRIRSDRSIPYRVIEPILLTCAQLGIWNVKFAVVRPEDAAGE